MTIATSPAAVSGDESASPSFVQVAAWPVVIGACFLVVVLSPTWFSTSAVIAVAGIIVLGLERSLPFRHAWIPTRRDWLVGFLYLGLSSAIAGGLQYLMTRGAVRPMSLGERAAWIAGGLIAMDAAAYVAHRALHRVRVVWPIHAVHHALPRVFFLNALHNHVIDIALSTACSLLPLWALGLPPDIVAAIGALSVAHFWFQHTNADLRLGWLNRVIAGPELHRWHHSTVSAEADSNYGMVFAFWDVWFGTWRAPGAPISVGPPRM